MAATQFHDKQAMYPCSDESQHVFPAVASSARSKNLLCRTGYCKVQIRDLNVKDLTASLAISKQLPKGMILSKLKDAAWRKEGFLLVNVIRGTATLLSSCMTSLLNTHACCEHLLLACAASSFRCLPLGPVFRRWKSKGEALLWFTHSMSRICSGAWVQEGQHRTRWCTTTLTSRCTPCWCSWMAP